MATSFGSRKPQVSICVPLHLLLKGGELRCFESYMPSGLLSPEKVAALNEARGIDLRVVEAAARRKADSRRTSLSEMEVPQTTEKPAFMLPAVGRHTQALENKVETRVRKPSIQEVPDLKKAKTEAPDIDMPAALHVEPGDSIESQGSAEEANIPTSPHFASNLTAAPHFDLTVNDDGDKTQEDEDEPDVEVVLPGSKAPDELAGADIDALPAAPVAPEFGALHAATPNSTNSSRNLYPNSSRIQNSSGSEGNQQPGLRQGPQPAAGILKWAGLDKEPAPPFSDLGNVPYPETMPLWVQEIRDGFFGLHQKADRIHQEMVSFGPELQAHSTRIESLEQVASEHTSRHLAQEQRIHALEAKLEALLHDKSDMRSRSPSRTGLGTGNRSPSPRSPRFSRGDHFGEPEDLDIVVGGWSDARKNDAFDEVKNIFQAIQHEDAIEEIWSPYSRTSFAKVKLRFPDPQATIQVRRQFQMMLVGKIKNKNFKSGVPGSDGLKIWATKSKTPEERAKIRAIVLTKEFFKQVKAAGAAKYTEDQIEISWQGKVYIDRYQLLGSVERDGEPQMYDVCIEDSKGNHMNWYIKAAMFSIVTGHPQELLQETWLTTGPTSAHARAES